MNTDSFQGKCLKSIEGYRLMRTHYDHLPRDVRLRLQSSTYNICPACVEEFHHAGMSYMDAVDQMEATIKSEELLHEESIL